MNAFINFFRRAWAIADKEWIQIRRDTRSLALSIFIPSFLIVVFGYALTLDVKHVKTAVYDQDRSAFSRSLIERFSHTEYFAMRGYVSGYQEIDRLINTKEILMAVVIPRDFEKRYKSGKKAGIQLLVDGSDSTSATVAAGYAKAVLADFNIGLAIKELRKVGISDFTVPVDVRNRIWYNPELKSKNFIIPGLVALILAIISALITSLTISREWERGTMESLITTPVRKGEVLAGKLAPYIVIGAFDVVLTVSLGHFIFGVPIKGSFLELLLISVLFLIGKSSLGMFISFATRVQVLSIQYAMTITYMPTILLSGFIFPVNNMPYFVQGITYLVPAKYLIVVLKGIAMKGVGVVILWTQIAFLLIFAVLVQILCLRKFKLKLPD